MPSSSSSSSSSSEQQQEEESNNNSNSNSNTSSSSSSSSTTSSSSSFYIPSSIRKTLLQGNLVISPEYPDQRYLFDEYLDDSDTDSQCFYERTDQDFKHVCQFLEDECYPTIRQELSQVTETDFIKWPESICKTGWTVFGLMAFGRELPENCAKCPFTTNAIRAITSKYGFEVSTAGFSCLKPGTHIVPHKGYEGYSDYVVRLHMGLVVPQPQSEALKCSIRVGNEKRSWVQGQCLIFDDLLTHEAWNFSNQTRIILLVDLKYTKKSYLTRQQQPVAALLSSSSLPSSEEDEMNPDCKNANFSRDLRGLLSSIDKETQEQQSASPTSEQKQQQQQPSEQDISKFFK